MKKVPCAHIVWIKAEVSHAIEEAGIQCRGHTSKAAFNLDQRNCEKNSPHRGPSTLEGHRDMGSGQWVCVGEEGGYLWSHRLESDWVWIPKRFGLYSLLMSRYLWAYGIKLLCREGRSYKGNEWKNVTLVKCWRATSEWKKGKYGRQVTGL